MDIELNILIIDDDLGDRKTLKRSLMKNGFNREIFEAESIEDAVQFEGKLIDCVIVDHYLPGLKGLESVEFLRDSFPDACIILISGKGDEDLARNAYKEGADDYIPKRLINDQVIKQLLINAIERRKLKMQVDRDLYELKKFNLLLEKDFSFQMISMKQMTSSLSDALINEDHDKVGELIERMEAEGAHVQGLIRSMIEYHSLRELKNPEMKKVRLEAILDKIKLHFRDEFKDANSSLEYTVLPFVEGNTYLLTKLFQNLISNSILYCKSNPKINVTAEDLDEYKVRIVVSDNGVGISDENLERIFNPFERMPFKNQYTGAGLGLATCRKIAEIHHGEITCDSEVGRGSQFKITFNKA
tara:strand:- start:226 stop:1299 length:1074 start_codon:yes stop_codon:yes gene_type:complete